MKINWYPGHMAKTKRLMQEDIRQIDLVCELLDARIPWASRNPDLSALAGQKKRIIVLNRADQADPQQTEEWKKYFKSKGFPVIALDSQNGGGYGEFLPLVRQVMAQQIARNEEKGLKGKSIRIMACGIPNVGKSSFINRILGRRSAVAQDRPGVTRQNRWFTVGKGFELLDTPGVLWPKFEDPIVGEHLAFTGAVRDEILDMESLAARLLELLMELYPNAINSRYKTDIRPEEHLPGHELLERVGRKRGMLVSGGEVNTERAAITVLDEYRGGKLGRITLERP